MRYYDHFYRVRRDEKHKSPIVILRLSTPVRWLTDQLYKNLARRDDVFLTDTDICQSIKYERKIHVDCIVVIHHGMVELS